MKNVLLISLVALSWCSLGVAEETVEARYTPLDLDRCRMLEVFGEGGGVALACAGLDSLPVFVTESDLRFDVDFGRADDRFDTFAPFHTLGPTIEWRVADGTPFAAILRFTLDDPEDPGARKGSVLAVYRIGRGDAPGCPLAYVDALANVNANAHARNVADERARSFRCGRDRASYVGRTGSLSGDATATKAP